MEKEIKEDLEDMCNLGQGLVEKADARGEVRGEVRGIIQTALDFGASESEIISKVQEKMNVSMQQAQDYFKMYGRKNI